VKDLGLVFVNLDVEAEPLLAALRELLPQAAKYKFGEMRLAGRRDYHMHCNWKAYIDNYLEGYHVPLVHPGLHKELDYDNYRVETSRYYSSQHAPVRKSAPSYAGEVDIDYFWLFPNVMLNAQC